MRRLWILMLVGLLAGVIGASLSAQTPVVPQALFGAADLRQLQRASPLEEQAGTLRTRLAALDSVALSSGLRDGGLLLNLFDDVTLTVQAAPSHAPMSRNISDVNIWTGAVDGLRYGQAVIVTSAGGVIDLRVLTPGYVYYVQTVGDGLVRISEIQAGRGRYDAGGRAIEDSVVYTPTDAELAVDRARLREVGARADDGTVIDVLAAYTPAAAAMLGGDLNAQLAIQGAAALTNLTYANSGVNFRIRLVGVVRTDYVESSFNDLSRLQSTGDGFMDELHTLRNTLKADMVSLTPGTAVANRNYCGIAFLPNPLTPSSAFSITEAHCINDITYAHELGHNMGKQHDRANGSGAIHPYAFGYQDPSTGVGDYGDFVTLMAYSTNPNGTSCPSSYLAGACPAIAWWSDPNDTFAGKTLGSVIFEDNARSLNETALTIANYRLSDDGGATTPTPFPTLTLVPLPTAILTLTDWALNGGFEIDADHDGKPDGWNLNKAVYFCDTAANLTRGLTGTCSIRLKSGARIRQNLTPSGSVTGQILTLGFEANGKNVPAGATVTLAVIYLSPTAGLNGDGRDLLTVNLPGGVFVLPVSAQGSLTLADAVTSVTLRARYPAGVGNLRLDSISLTVE